jgi:hypothetical protein
VSGRAIRFAGRCEAAQREKPYGRGDGILTGSGEEDEERVGKG